MKKKKKQISDENATINSLIVQNLDDLPANDLFNDSIEGHVIPSTDQDKDNLANEFGDGTSDGGGASEDF